MSTSPHTWTPPPGTPGWAADIVQRIQADIAAGRPLTSDTRPDFYEGPAVDLGHPDGWQQAQDAWEREYERRWP